MGHDRKRLCGEADEVIDYGPRNILNLDKLGLFFKALPEKVLIEKGKKTKGGRKSKQRMTVIFIVTSDSSFVFEPTVIWTSKRPHCFKSLKDLLRPMSVHYFFNKKAWKKVVLFLDNATYHLETFQVSLTNIKLVFLSKNTTSRLQPFEAGIIKNFKHKYRKLLVRYVVSRIDEGKTASQI